MASNDETLRSRTYVLDPDALSENCSLEELGKLATGTGAQTETTADTDSAARPAPDANPPPKSAARNSAGSFVTDAKGNRVWEWATVVDAGATSILKGLGADSLKLKG
jgi:hypothetical protein